MSDRPGRDLIPPALGRRGLLLGTAGLWLPAVPPAAAAEAAETATQFDVVPDASAGGVGAARRFALAPVDGVWPAGSVTLAAKGAAGRFEAATVALPAGGTARVSLAFTPAEAGALEITAANTAGMRPPFPIHLSIFDPAPGTPGALAGGTQDGTDPDWHHHARGVDSGDPAGWRTRWNKGWGRLVVTVTPSVASGAVYARAYDALSAGATAAAGSGRMVQDAVQVGGPVAAGRKTVLEIVWPASPDWQYVELALDRDFTTPLRLAKPVSVGDQTFVETRSNKSGIGGAYASVQPGSSPVDLSVLAPYTKGATLTSDRRNFVRQDGLVDYLFKTPGAMEYCRILAVRTGVTHAILGYPIQGGAMEDHNGAEPATPSVNLQRVVAQAGSGARPRFYLWEVTGSNNPNGDLSLAQRRRYQRDLFADLQRRYPGPLAIAAQAASGFGLFDQSMPSHWGRQTKLVRDEFETATGAIVAADSNDFGGLFLGHSTPLSKVREARMWARFVLSTQVAGKGGFARRGNRGPICGGTGSRAPGSLVIAVPYTHHGGTQLFAYKAVEGPVTSATVTESVATPQEMRAQVAVRLAGEVFLRGRIDARGPADGSLYRNGPGVAIKLARVDIDNARNRLLITLSSATPGALTFLDNTTMPLTNAVAFTVQVQVDSNVEGEFPFGGGTIVAFVDDQRHDGITYGWPMRPSFDIYVPAPVPAVAPRLGLASPGSVVTNGWLEVRGPRGTGRGAAVGGVEVAVNGGGRQVPVELVLYQDNSWHGWVKAPAAAGPGNTVAVYRPGEAAADATANFTTIAPAALRGRHGGGDPLFMALSAEAAGRCVASYSARNGATLRGGDGAPVRENMQDVLAWEDETGEAGNRLVPGAANTRMPAPALDLTAGAGFDLGTVPVNLERRRPGVVFQVAQSLVTSSGAPLLGRLAGDFTIVASLYFAMTPAGGAVWSLAGGNGGIAMLDRYGAASFRRGGNKIAPAPTVFRPFGSYGCVPKLVLRYRAADGLFEAFGISTIGGNWRKPVLYAGASTAAPEPMALTGLTLAPKWGCVFELQFYDLRFGGDQNGGDVAATLNWLTRVVG